MSVGLSHTFVEVLSGLASSDLGQAGSLDGSFRPYLYVLLAFAAGWILVGAWVFQIGRKVNRLSNALDEVRDEERPRH